MLKTLTQSIITETASAIAFIKTCNNYSYYYSKYATCTDVNIITVNEEIRHLKPLAITSQSSQVGNCDVETNRGFLAKELDACSPGDCGLSSMWTVGG